MGGVQRNNAGIKNQLFAAIDNTYLQGIKDPTTEFHNITVLHMLDYLYDNYGKINEDSKSENIEKMKGPYDVTTPIEVFFQRIQDCIDFASAARIMLTTQQILNSAFLTVQQTGFFTQSVESGARKIKLTRCGITFVPVKEGHDNFREDQYMTAQKSSQFNANAITSTPPA